MKKIFFLGLVSCCVACNSETKDAVADTTVAAIQPTQEIKMVTADSVEVLYYRKPFTDKERYTRYFANLVSKDTGFIQMLQSLLLLPGVEEDSLRACMSEGKINIPLKGDAYQVVYFSREEPPCQYLYVIRSGKFYYYTLDDQLRQKLTELEKQAKEQ